MSSARLVLLLLLSALLAPVGSGCGEVSADLIVRASLPVECQSNGDCGAAAPVCDLAAAVCVRCLEASDCESGQICALPAHSCVSSCLADPDVCRGPRPFCEPTTGLCRACTGDGECTPDAPRCHPSGACVVCLEASHCADSGSEAPFCDTDSGRCVECLADGHCDELGERCSRVLGWCAEPCSAGVACSDEPICDVDLGFCVECRLDSECEDDEVCRRSECVELDDDDDEEDDDD